MNRFTSAYLIARLAVGVSLFGHGLVRIPILNGFSNWMTGLFEKSYLPQGMVLVFSYVLPFAELLTGLLIIIGLFTREALIAGGIIMIALIFGSTTIQQWDAIPAQLIHIAFISVLLAFIEYNGYAIDRLYGRKS